MKQDKFKFYVMKLWMTNVDCLIQGNPQGALSGSNSTGYYSHIELRVT